MYLKNGLIAEDTAFGWVLAGRCLDTENSVSSSCFSIVMDVDESLRRFWEIEAIPSCLRLTDEEQQCEDWFVSTTTRAPDGRFIIKLPFRKQAINLGSSRQAAITQLIAMERRFKRDPRFQEMYKEFMIEYEQLQHIKEIPSDPTTQFQYYMPHYGVLKESSSTTKLRVVFDASAKSNNNTSLNNSLLVGPLIQSSLVDIILRFCKYKFVLTGDIEKMYQKIVWRSDDQQKIGHYQLKTLTYGTGLASFIAARCFKELAMQNAQAHPEAAEAIADDMYVDDIMAGARSKEKLPSLKH